MKQITLFASFSTLKSFLFSVKRRTFLKRVIFFYLFKFFSFRFLQNISDVNDTFDMSKDEEMLVIVFFLQECLILPVDFRTWLQLLDSLFIIALTTL